MTSSVVQPTQLPCTQTNFLPGSSAGAHTQSYVPATPLSRYYFAPPTQGTQATQPLTQGVGLLPGTAAAQQQPDLTDCDLTVTHVHTFVVQPPWYKHLHHQHNPISHVVLADPLLVIATTAMLAVYDIDVDRRKSPVTLIAEWPCPRMHSIEAMAIAPDASVISVLVYGSETAALVLLKPRTCTMLFRLALPDSFPTRGHSTTSSTLSSSKPQRRGRTTTTTSDIHSHVIVQVRPSLAFVSSTPGLLPSASPPSDALPPHFRSRIASTPRIRRCAAAAVTAAVQSLDISAWALLLSGGGRQYCTLLMFRRGYKRLHQINYIELPHSTTVLSHSNKLHVFRRLDQGGGLTAGFHTTRDAFRLVNASFDQVIACSDVALHTVVACGGPNNAAVVACTRANSTLAVAVLDDASLTLAATDLKACDVRAVALLPVPGFNPVLAVVTPDGLPRVVASVAPPKHTTQPALPRVAVVRQNQDLPTATGATATTHRHEGDGGKVDVEDGNDWFCTNDVDVALMVSGDAIIAAYAKGRRVILRVSALKGLQGVR